MVFTLPPHFLNVSRAERCCSPVEPPIQLRNYEKWKHTACSWHAFPHPLPCFNDHKKTQVASSTMKTKSKHHTNQWLMLRRKRKSIKHKHLMASSYSTWLSCLLRVQGEVIDNLSTAHAIVIKSKQFYFESCHIYSHLAWNAPSCLLLDSVKVVVYRLDGTLISLTMCVKDIIKWWALHRRSAKDQYEILSH